MSLDGTEDGGTEEVFSFTFITASDMDTEWMLTCYLQVREMLTKLGVTYSTFSGDVDVDGPTTMYTVGFTVTKNTHLITDDFIANFNDTHQDVDLERADTD